MKTRKLTTMAVLTVVALTIFIAEAQIPVPIPGVKLGLSNIITVYAVYALGAGEGALILFARILLGSLFSGQPVSFFYSAAGGALAILTTIGLKKVLPENQLWISGCLSAIAHSIGQMAVAFWIAGTTSVFIYLPILIICSSIAGIFTGLCAQLLVKRGKDLWKTIFK